MCISTTLKRTKTKAENRINVYFVLTFFALTSQDVVSELAPTWTLCNCRFEEWKPYSDCTKTCGGGYKYRYFYHYHYYYYYYYYYY